MKFRPSPYAVILVSVLALTSCGGSYSNGGLVSSLPTYPNAVLTLTPALTSIQVGGTQIFTAAATNDPLIPAIQLGGLFGAPPVGYNAGTLAAIGNGSTALYTAPSTPPIELMAGYPSSQQGIVDIEALVGIGNVAVPIYKDVTFPVLAPTVTAGCFPATASVTHGSAVAVALNGYAVGNINNNITWQVNGVTGGSTAAGTVTTTGSYTAPANIPMSGANVNVTAVSVADPTKSGTCVVTVQ